MPESTVDILTSLIRDLSVSVARIDERVKTVQDDVTLIRADMKETKETFREDFRDAETANYRDFVKKTEFEPIKRFVYGTVGFILVSVGTIFFTYMK